MDFIIIMTIRLQYYCGLSRLLCSVFVNLPLLYGVACGKLLNNKKSKKTILTNNMAMLK